MSSFGRFFGRLPKLVLGFLKFDKWISVDTWICQN